MKNNRESGFLEKKAVAILGDLISRYPDIHYLVIWYPDILE